MTQPEVLNIMTQPQILNIMTQPQVLNIMTQPQNLNLMTQPQILNIMTQPQIPNIMTQPQTPNIMTQPEILNIMTQPQILNIMTQPQILNIMTQHWWYQSDILISNRHQSEGPCHLGWMLMAWRHEEPEHELSYEYYGLSSRRVNPSPLSSTYRKTSNISHTFIGNKIVDKSDVVGVSPTTSSFST